METLIRLATAHAKARLSQTVDQRDAEAAHQILLYALFKEAGEEIRQRQKRRKAVVEKSEEEGEEANQGGEEEEEEEEVILTRRGTQSRPAPAEEKSKLIRFKCDFYYS